MARKTNILQIPKKGAKTPKSKATAPVKTTLGERLISAREDGAKRVSRGDLAKFLKVSTQAVQHWESNKNKPRRNRLIQIAEYFGINIAWLEYGIGERWAVSDKPVYGVKITGARDDRTDLSQTLDDLTETARNSALPPQQIQAILRLTIQALDARPPAARAKMRSQ